METRTEISTSGRCSICGFSGEYIHDVRSVRESYKCSHCKASLRYRHQATVIVESYTSGISQTLTELCSEPHFRDLGIYEPGTIGPFRAVFKQHEHYVISYYWPGLQAGERFKGVRHEDLQALSFDDSSFDLVITSDIFEHVRKPFLAFAEIYRVLRPGGRHIFTIPLEWPIPPKSVSRVDTSGDKDVYLLPPVYHSGTSDPNAGLVYTDYGLDLLERLEEIGFRTTYSGLLYNVTFCSEKP